MDTVRAPQPPRSAAQPQQHQHVRVDLRELKAQMEKRLGPECARRYFSYLTGYLSQKLSKPEFDKLCLLALGRENLPLHNRLIRSVLKNACQSIGPTPPPLSAAVKKASQAAEMGPAQCNGDVVPLPPHHQYKDRLKLGPNGNHSSVAYDKACAVRGNGALSSYDIKRSLRFQQLEPTEPPAKQPRVEKPFPHESVVHVLSRCVSDAAEHSDLQSTRGPLRAPLGIPFCSASVGGARKSLPPATSASDDRFSSCYEYGELCHTEVLRRRMEKIAEAQGLVGVTMDCADLLNNGLDVYLKNLIRSSVELIGARARNDAIRDAASKQLCNAKHINGVWLPNHVQIQTGGGLSEAAHETRSHHLISLQDFKVAMELNAQQLGEDWPVLLEKICLCSSEEKD